MAEPSPSDKLTGIGLDGKQCDMVLTLARIMAMIEQAEERYRLRHERIGRNRQHFHNDPAVDPALPKPFNEGPKYQSDAPRRIHRALRARLTENIATITAKAKSEAGKAKQAATNVELYFNDGISNLRERMGASLQDFASDGQIIDCYAVLHWSRALDMWPDVPEPDFLEAGDGVEMPKGYEGVYEGLSDGKEYAGEFAEYEVEDGLPVMDGDTPIRRKLKGYRETTDTVNKRYQRMCAEAGFVWNVEFPDPAGYMEVRDRSLLGQPAISITRRTVGLLEYVENVNEERKKLAGSLNELNEDIPVFGEVDAPVDDGGLRRGTQLSYPSDADWGDVITVYGFWTRDEYYELASGLGHEWEVVKCGKHPHKRPPFEVIAAQTIRSPDPLLAYEPALEGVYRLKPLFDMWKSHMLVISQQIALPYYYWKRTGTGEPLLNEKGVAVTFDQDTANAEAAPEGYELAKVDYEMNPAFVEAGRDLAQEIKDAEPATGQAEFTSSTQPWAIRLQQQQANVEPKVMIGNQALGIRAMVRNMAMVQSLDPTDGGTGPVWVFARTDGGAVDRDNVVELKPEDILSLDIDVNITATSGAEQITLEQHGMELLTAGLITAEDFYENYLRKENPQEYLMNLKATRLYEQQIEPAIAQGALQEAFAGTFGLGTGGQMVDAFGNAVTSQQVLAANGQQPSMPPQGNHPQLRGMRPQQSMGGMGTLATEGTIPIQSGVG